MNSWEFALVMFIWGLVIVAPAYVYVFIMGRDEDEKDW